ncbi:MAG: CDP-diacylglycerol--serine O-phosphatidyltransferase [Bacteroidetes bacterium]|nr:CDP-diacylglycerol--serine O-phosphatidyltransferase [Bacteroidota bacterium]MDA1119444.1 CDP-diacylglycerol--serine O-phosphatidyltransferase [Bacteroidota bacterium]
MKFKRHIPNFFTSLNLLTGCVGIVYISHGDIESAPYFVLGGAFFDFLDGFVARILNVFSDVGKELDSLADMVTFGVLPSIFLFEMLKRSGSNEILPFIAFSVAVFAALRLAKFNVDTLQRDVFIGLPTPACAIFLTGLIFLDNSYSALISNTSFLIVVIVVFSLVMVSPIKFVALKFKSRNMMGNEAKIVLMVGALILGTLFGIESISALVIWYMIVSFVSGAYSKI